MSKSPDAPNPASLMISPEKTDRFVRSLAAHPYLWALAVCLIIDPFHLGAAENAPLKAYFFELLIMLATGFGLIYILFKNGALDRIKAAVCGAVYFGFVCFSALSYSAEVYRGLWLFIFAFAVLVLLYRVADTKKFNDQLCSLLILSVGFLLKLYYVFYSSCYVRQHDVHAFGGADGHAAYIEYLLFNHKLPDFDVREVWQFCHPPLHHFISALWIAVNENIFGVGHDPARESLQTLTLFYSMTIMISAYKIFRHFKLKGTAMYVPLAIVSFHPSFTLFSGSINNDVLSVAFMMGAFVCTLEWYENQTLGNILKIALCVGLGMMTKLSAALIAPPIAIVFLVVFIKKIKTDWKRLIGQFAAFGVVCVPLGLWFEIRNYINYRVPITYVQEMSPQSIQYLGDRRFIDRITDFSSYQFSNVFEQWLNSEGRGYNEFNPLVTLLKNSVFGEYINENALHHVPVVIFLSKILFWVAALIAGACLLMMIFNTFTKSGIDPLMKVFWVSFYLMMIGNFYKMAHDYPFTCTMNFRYITPTVIIGAFFAGITVKRLNASEKIAAAVAVKVISAVTVMFCALSMIVYVQLCLPTG